MNQSKFVYESILLGKENSIAKQYHLQCGLMRTHQEEETIYHLTNYTSECPVGAAGGRNNGPIESAGQYIQIHMAPARRHSCTHARIIVINNS